ncbi:PilX N-terminal domain-containing pilus assembly protein [Vulgatibacter incomptus]|uniref:Type 4 fimbrial biogenesis protein PilX N-terminal domain-containing protein n=1 Tax=Vulgatibacter incomptus TaxID=1391653 RepID=A0A0K1PB08_9BACT|nr:PilX N-terminal domain-containing pilus assembly protein [Vulgatibacter incomptus]AKU90304.1 hypothetical protein AKJ08_0691 [Vulgatibacter incomptus]
MRRSPRGFSLLTVLLVLVVLAIVGTMSLTLSTGQVSVATSRTIQRQALAAAEAGLSHFFGNAPTQVQADRYYVGSESNYVYLRNTPSETMGEDGKPLQARYRVRSTADVLPVADSVLLVSEGEVLANGRVVGRSRVEAIVTASDGTGLGTVGQGQKSLGAWGTSSNLSARTDISLIFPGGNP